MPRWTAAARCASHECAGAAPPPRPSRLLVERARGQEPGGRPYCSAHTLRRPGGQQEGVTARRAIQRTGARAGGKPRRAAANSGRAPRRSGSTSPRRTLRPGRSLRGCVTVARARGATRWALGPWGGVGVARRRAGRKREKESKAGKLGKEPREEPAQSMGCSCCHSHAYGHGGACVGACSSLARVCPRVCAHFPRESAVPPPVCVPSSASVVSVVPRAPVGAPARLARRFGPKCSPKGAGGPALPPHVPRGHVAAAAGASACPRPPPSCPASRLEVASGGGGLRSHQLVCATVRAGLPRQTGQALWAPPKHETHGANNATPVAESVTTTSTTDERKPSPAQHASLSLLTRCSASFGLHACIWRAGPRAWTPT